MAIENDKPLFTYYLNVLNYSRMPSHIEKYLTCPSLRRLSKRSYFSGMDYASNSVIDISEHITMYDTSLSGALLASVITHRKKEAIAALFRNIGTHTQIFSDAVSKLNIPSDKPVSAKKILEDDPFIVKYLLDDGLTIDELINLSHSTLISGPNLSIDTLESIIIPGMVMTKDIYKDDIIDLIESISVYINDSKEEELGFDNYAAADKVMSISSSISDFYNSEYYTYMVEFLSDIIKKALDEGIFTNDDLLIADESFTLRDIERSGSKDLQNLLYQFKNMKKEDIKVSGSNNHSTKRLCPLVNGYRLH